MKAWLKDWSTPLLFGVIAVLVGVVLVLSVTVSSHTNTIVSQHTTELQKATAAANSAAKASKSAEAAAKSAAAAVALINRALSESKHPSEVGQSIEYQVCRAVDGIDHALHIKPGCRIP